MSKKISAQFERSANTLSVHFGQIRQLYLKHINIIEEKEQLSQQSYNPEDVRKAKRIPWIKHFAIIFETILAVRGFEYLFIAMIEINVPRWSIFFLSFGLSYLIIEASHQILYFLKDLNKGKAISRVDFFSAMLPLLLVPCLNVAAYLYDVTDEKEIYLVLAVATLLINISIVNLLSKVVYDERYAPKFRKLHNRLVQLKKDDQSIKKQFRLRYKLIEDESNRFFRHYQKLNGKVDIPMAHEYLWLLQNRIFQNRNVDFRENIKKMSVTPLHKWWDTMTSK